MVANLHIPSNSLIPNHCDSRDRYFMQLQCRTDSYKYFPPPSSYGTPSPIIINSLTLISFVIVHYKKQNVLTTLNGVLYGTVGMLITLIKV